MSTPPDDPPPVVPRSRLIRDLRTLGVEAGQVVMLHASVKAVGWVVGGPDVVLQALLDILGPDGTLTMLASTEDSVYELADWPEEKRRAYLEECPPFDPERTRAHRKWSILTEYLRTWPGAVRSAHPDASYSAVGRLAEWITAGHPFDYGHGPGSPLAKLCECGGQVLLLGTPFTTLTLLHHAEHLADVPGKRIVRYRAPVLAGGERQWVEIEEFDTCSLIGGGQGDDYFETIPRQALAAGLGQRGQVGAADAVLFDADRLVRFAVDWLERHLGSTPETTS